MVAAIGNLGGVLSPRVSDRECTHGQRLGPDNMGPIWSTGGCCRDPRHSGSTHRYTVFGFRID